MIEREILQAFELAVLLPSFMFLKFTSRFDKFVFIRKRTSEANRRSFTFQGAAEKIWRSQQTFWRAVWKITETAEPSSAEHYVYGRHGPDYGDENRTWQCWVCRLIRNNIYIWGRLALLFPIEIMRPAIARRCEPFSCSLKRLRASMQMSNFERK